MTKKSLIIVAVYIWGYSSGPKERWAFGGRYNNNYVAIGLNYVASKVWKVGGRFMRSKTVYLKARHNFILATISCTI